VLVGVQVQGSFMSEVSRRVHCGATHVDICSFDFLVTNITFSNLNSLGVIIVPVQFTDAPCMLSLLGRDMDPGWSMATLPLPLAGTNGLTNDTTSSPMLLLIVNIYLSKY
jgi:hypothetical protein